MQTLGNMPFIQVGKFKYILREQPQEIHAPPKPPSPPVAGTPAPAA